MSISFELPPVYPIVNVVVGSAADDVDVARGLAIELIDAGAEILQLRAKHLGAGAFADLARAVVAAASRTGCRVLINDRADVALASGAAGVHLGDEDLPVDAARRVLGAGAIIGYSTHSVEELAAAASLDADYLAFGPVFESPTKAGVRVARGLELLAEAGRVSARPLVAIGGIMLETAPRCWRAGAASVAVIREIETCADRRALLDQYQTAALAAR